MEKNAFFSHFFEKKFGGLQKMYYLCTVFSKTTQFATTKTTTKNAQTIQKDCKTSAKIIQKFDTYKQISNKIPKKDFLQPKNAISTLKIIKL